MKAKYFGLFSISLLLTTLVGSALYSGVTLGRKASLDLSALNRRVDETKTMAGNAPKPDTGSHAAMKRIQDHLWKLRQPPEQTIQTVNLAMLGYSEQSLNAMDADLSPVEDFSHRVVTMAYVSKKGDKRFAVIGDRLYHEGEALDDEQTTQVNTITPQKVLLSGRKVRQWIEVSKTEPPLPGPDAAAPPRTLAQSRQAAGKPLRADPAHGNLAQSKATQPPATGDSDLKKAMDAMEAVKGLAEMLKR